MPELIVENGHHKGQRTVLVRETPCIIGTADDCTLRLDDPEVASEHAVVKALKDEGFGIKSLAGKFMVNGQRTEVARLEDGDQLDLGSVRLIYSASEKTTATAGKNMLGGFKLIEVLGKGGMGTVYRAEQVSLHREVALKVLSKKLTKDPVFVARFVAEARAAARLHHPNVVQVFDVGHEDDTYYYSMELMHEGSLEQELRSRGKIPETEALQLTAAAAYGLSYANSLRIVHRDIKPDNLMIDRHGQVKIADLGLALTDEDDLSNVAGTPHFMSPEQALRNTPDHRSDLYSLGCTLYRLLTGQTPFQGDSVKEILRAHVKDAPEPPSKVNPEISSEASAIVDKLLEKQLDQRYQTADDLLLDLEQVIAPATRKGLLIGSAIAALVIAVGGIYYGMTRPEGKTETIVKEIKNPADKKLVAENRELKAEAAFWKISASDLDGIELALALEGMAEDHQETQHAGKGLAAAKQIRTRIETAKQAKQKFEQAVQQEVTRLEIVVREAISQADYTKANDILDNKSGPQELRDHPVVANSYAKLRSELISVMSQRLTSMKQALENALEDRNQEATTKALAALEAVLNDDKGWPLPIFSDADDLRKYIGDGYRRHTAQQQSEQRDAVAQSWQIFREGVFSPDGFMARIRTFDFVGAANAASETQKRLGNFIPREVAEHLAVAAREADGFLQVFTKASADGTLSYKPPGSDSALPIISFTTSGDQAGLTVKDGPRIRPKPRLIPLTELLAENPATVFTLPDAPDTLGRAAFLGLLSLDTTLQNAHAYIAAIDSGDDTSGIGEQSYLSGNSALPFATTILEGRGPSWADALHREMLASQILAQALRAMSERRNIAAATHLERLLAEYPRSCVVQKFH